ncbi:MAG: hypothetical protein WC593_06875 [Methanoregula sp.]
MEIEIIGILDDKKYSIGKISVSKKGDVYIFHKQKGLNFHTSRHKSGSLHWKPSPLGLKQPIRHSTPTDDFKGIEQLECWAHSQINSAKLSGLYPEYKMKKQDDKICAINFGAYMGEFDLINLMVFMLTQEGIPFLYTSSNNLTKRQIYLYADSFPMIGIIVGTPGGFPSRRE